jgi:lipoprotein-releasing system permease protein
MIGTLKSFGCTNSSILKIFLYNSVKITKKGLLYGNIIGLLLCYMQKTTHIIQLNPESYFIDYVPIDINIKYIILINILTFIIIQISIIIPYGIIKKINPANILKIN